MTRADDLRALAGELAAEARPGLTYMEVCGTHTMAIARFGLRDLLPDGMRLVSGPGCPVCVTAMADLDRAVALARLPGVTLVTFGDLVRVPASRTTLAAERAAGADVRVVYSPLDAVEIAASEPEREVVPSCWKVISATQRFRVDLRILGAVVRRVRGSRRGMGVRARPAHPQAHLS